MKFRLALFLRAAQSPVLVVVLGVLFAIQQGGIVSFSHTWPLLIIVFGLMKLTERLLTPHAPHPGVPPQ
ncbi:MAG: LiaI-LiaF-like domain-containing protein [Bryobacteraceae bacterium]